MVPLQAQDVTIYLTGHRIHTEGRKLRLKERLKMAHFLLHESGFPGFGRPWTPNQWHQVKVSGTPENWYYASNGQCGRLMASELSALKLFSVLYENWEKSIFLVKRSVPKIFQREYFSGLVPGFVTHSGLKKVHGLCFRASISKLYRLKVRQ